MGEGSLAGDKAVEQGLLTITGDLSLAKVLEHTQRRLSRNQKSYGDAS